MSDPATELELIGDREAIRAEHGRARVYSEASRRLLRDGITIDMTLPFVSEAVEQGVLDRARAAGFGFVSVTVAVDGMGQEDALAGIAAVRRFAEERQEAFLFARGPEDIRTANSQGKTAVGVHFQGTTPIGGTLDLLPLYRELGITHMLLAYNARNFIADGCAEKANAGLSRFGRELVKEMRALGILCDGSHTGYRSTMEAMELYGGPFIFSHSNCKAIFDHYRNVGDDQIKACAASGGVIGVNAVASFLGDPFARAETIFHHVDHIVSLVGPEHAGIGLDHVAADPDANWKRITMMETARPGLWPANVWPPNNGRAALIYGVYAPHGVIGEVVDVMLGHGYPEEAIRGFLGANFLSVLERVAASSTGRRSEDNPVN